MSIGQVRWRVVVVDGSKTMQAMLDNAFSTRSDFEILAFSSDAYSAAAIVRKLMPDIVTIDLQTPDMDSIALLQMISDLTSVCKIIVADKPFSDLFQISRLIDAGAAVCLKKSDLISDPTGFFKRLNLVGNSFGRISKNSVSAESNILTAIDAINPSSVHETQFPFPVPEDESKRLDFIARKQLNNAIRERHFDLVTTYLAKVTSFSSCLLTFIDRDTQWIKSVHGMDVKSTPRSHAFCNYTIAHGGTFVVSDATKDKRFYRNPLVLGPPNIRTYAGHAVVNVDGITVGALCLIDNTVRTVSKQVLTQLTGMAEIVAEMIDQRSSISD